MGNDWVNTKAALYCREFSIQSGDMLYTLKQYLREAQARETERAAKLCEIKRDSGNPSTWIADLCAREIRASAAKDSKV